jgi:WD40 repeat protein
VTLEGTVAYFDFSPDGRRLAAQRRDRTIGVFDTETGEEVKRLPHKAGRLAFHPDGRQLGFTVTDSRVAVVVDVKTGQEVNRYEYPDAPTSVAWSGDGRFLAVGCDDQRIYVWDHTQKQPQSVLEGHTSLGIMIQFSHAGHFLMSTSWDRSTRLWDAVTGQQLVRATGFLVGIRHDDRQIALGWWGVDPRLDLWEVAPGSECRTLHHGQVGNRTPRPDDWGPRAVDFSPDGRLLASASLDGTRLWELGTFTEVGQLPTGQTANVLFHPDGNSLFSYGTGGLHRWPIRREISLPAEQPDGITRLQVGPPQVLDVSGNWDYAGIHLDAKGRQLVAVDYPRGRAILLRLDEPGKKLVLTHPGVAGCALSPDGQWAFTWPAPPTGGVTKVWDTSSGKVVWEFPPGQTLSFISPDGHWIVTSPPRKEPLRFWQIGSWEPGATLPLNDAAQTGLMPSPDGRLLVSTRGLIRLHSFNGKELATLEAPRDGDIVAWRFSPDGTRLAVATGNHTVHVWDVREIRRQLAEIDLDWELPPYPLANPTLNGKPLRVEVVPGPKEWPQPGRVKLSRLLEFFGK